MSKENDKEAMKQLRVKRQRAIERARKKIKDQTRQLAAIRSQLKAQAGTVPEVAAALKMNTADVLIAVSALRKYGEVIEGAKDGSYFKYQIVEKTG
jgi:septal ring factor EnvC (AmiA/AmiB activator)